MSLDQSIANLTSQAGLLLDLPQQVADAANQKIDALSARYTAILNSASVSVFVNQSTGDDANEGTQIAPLKSIEAALALTPSGGLCAVQLMGDYHVTSDVLVQRKFLYLQSSTSQRHNVTFERTIRNIAGTDYRMLHGFKLVHGGQVYFVNLTLKMPNLDGSWGSYTPTFQGIIRHDSSSEFGNSFVNLGYCDIDIPASPFCSLLGFEGTPMTLYWVSNTMTDQAHLGRTFTGVTNTAGTSVVTIPWLLSNLTDI